MVKDTFKKKVHLFCQTPKKVQEAELPSVVERGVILKTELWDFGSLAPQYEWTTKQYLERHFY